LRTRIPTRIDGQPEAGRARARADLRSGSARARADLGSGRAPARLGILLAAAALTAALALPASPAVAGSGGISISDGDCVNRSNAKLSNGKAIPPCDAPGRVVRVIKAANEIAKGKGYCLGGGHGEWKSSCYDCSGSISYALHGGDLVDTQLTSGGFMTWGSQGRGRWITVYANSGHVYAVIAGLRFDTSMTPGEGPGWSDQMRSSDGYKVRHKGKL
jgi:hypothetical protein